MFIFYTKMFKRNNIINIFIELSYLQSIKYIINNTKLILIMLNKYILILIKFICFAFIIIMCLKLFINKSTIYNAWFIEFLTFIDYFVVELFVLKKALSEFYYEIRLSIDLKLKIVIIEFI